MLKEPGFAFLVIFYFWPFLRAFWGLSFFIFPRVLKQILEEPGVWMSLAPQKRLVLWDLLWDLCVFSSFWWVYFGFFWWLVNL